MISCAFLIPGDIELPTGGYAYDRRVLGLLEAHGVAARHVVLSASYPSPGEADLEETREAVERLRSDTVLLIDGLAYGAMPAALIAGFRRPIVALCHHPLALEAGLSEARQAALRASETEALAKAHHVIVTSPATRALLVREFGVPAGRITVAIPGTDPAPRSQGSDAGTRLLAVGSIVPRKGYDILIEALTQLADLDWTLTIVGAGDRSPATTEALVAQIAARGLAPRVTLAGALSNPDLSLQYGAADLFVMPSLFEGYGMVLAEAMARGLPIVCTTGGAAAETAPDAAAIKVPPGDVVALSDAIARVVRDRALKADMAKASWSAGLTLPRWEDTARLVAGAIRKVCA